MLTFTEQKNLFADLTKDNSSDNKNFGGTLINQYTKQIVNSRPWTFTEKLDESKSTVANQQFYKLPVDYFKLLMRPYITIGSIRYTMHEINDRAQWDRLNSVSNETSEIPTHFFIFNGELGIYPVPSTDGFTISIPYRAVQKTMVIDDYTTGSITDATNGSTTITGSGTSWNSSMVGRFLRIGEVNADPSGDGQWYEIASVNSGTEIDLVKNYEGETFSGGSLSYTIGQMSLLPDGYDSLPVYMSAEDYYISRGEQGEADRHRRKAEQMRVDLERAESNKTSNVAIEREDDIVVDHPANYPRDVS